MADRIEPFTVTVPAGTTQASFAEFSLPFRNGRVDRIEVHVPPGPSGLVGFRLAHSGQSVIPYTGDRWFIVDNAHLDWDTDNYPTGGAWEAWIYNEDIYEHSIEVWFHVTEIADNVPEASTPISIEPLGTAEEIESSPEDFADLEVSGGSDDATS
jgi:hypothetical protein